MEFPYSENVKDALEYACLLHQNDKYGDLPYGFHIHQTVHVAYLHKFPESVQIACCFHDAIEHGHLTYDNIRLNYGLCIAEAVYLVTDEKGRNRHERIKSTYPLIHKNSIATSVKVCDRYANFSHSQKNSKTKFAMYLSEHEYFMKTVAKINPNFESVENVRIEMISRMLEQIKKDGFLGKEKSLS